MLKIAAAQTTVSPDITANAAEIRKIMGEAAAEGVRLINFCEAALSGYSKFHMSSPDEWAAFDWATQEAELRSIADLCEELHIFAAVGGAHRLSGAHPPHNSLYIFCDRGTLLTRYDKRFLSNSELQGWYTPGADPVTFAIGTYKFGCAICIESQFPEVFSEYERLGVDAVLFSSFGIPVNFQIALKAHAGLNCIWISGATTVQKAAKGPAGIIGPDGNAVAHCPASPEAAFAAAVLDRGDPAYDIALMKARPWREKARRGDIYRDKMVADPRSADRSSY